MRRMKVTHKKFKSFDGTSIAYQIMGRGKKVIILCNGLGGTYLAWSPFYEYFGDQYKILTWDYRALFRSAVPNDPSRLTIGDHAHDLEKLLQHEKISKAFIAGWSMGVQVSLEFYKHHPKTCAGLFLINGTAGYPFHTALGSPLSRYILPKINELAQKIMPAVQPSIRPIGKKIVNWEGFVDIIVALGLIHKSIDKNIFKELAHEMLSTDLGRYHEIMKHLSEHNASDVLTRVAVPTLVIAGEADRVTPLQTAEKMAREIPQAQFFIVPKGTHYCVLEFPEIINLRVAGFLAENFPA